MNTFFKYKLWLCNIIFFLCHLHKYPFQEFIKQTCACWQTNSRPLLRINQTKEWHNQKNKKKTRKLKGNFRLSGPKQQIINKQIPLTYHVRRGKGIYLWHLIRYENHGMQHVAISAIPSIQPASQSDKTNNCQHKWNFVEKCGICLEICWLVIASLRPRENWYEALQTKQAGRFSIQTQKRKKLYQFRQRTMLGLIWWWQSNW